MNNHPYLRAYMAGITIPTLFLLVAMTAFCIARFVYDIPVPIERAIVFPMALVPNLWGLWNMLYVRLRPRRLSIGLHGAILTFLIAPLGLAAALHVLHLPTSYVFARFPIGFPMAVALYYLAWKHAVGFFNELLELA